MQVFENENARVRQGNVAKELAHGEEGLLAQLGRLEVTDAVGELAFLRRERHQIFDVWEDFQAFAFTGDKRCELRLNFFATNGGCVLRLDVKDAVEDLDKDIVCGLPIRDTTPFVHTDKFEFGGAEHPLF